MTVHDDDVLTIPEAAQYCAVDRVTMWRWVKSGGIKAWVTPGGHHRIYRRDLEAFMRENGITPHRDMHANPKILIVDDDRSIQRVLTKSLTKQGYETETASDGFDAGIKVMSFRPDLIILDLIMPGMDGFEVCRNVRSNDSTRSIRILALTGYGTPENRERVMSAGADGFLEKPASETVLLETIRDLLENDSESARKSRSTNDLREYTP